MDHSTQAFTSIINLSEYISNNSVINQAGQENSQEIVIARMFRVTTLPTLLIVGTIGNTLTFIIMQRGSLKHSTTCFYMSILALSDSCKYSLNTLLLC